MTKQQMEENEPASSKHERALSSPECSAAPITATNTAQALKTRAIGGSADCSHAVLLKRNSRGCHRRSQTIVAAGNLELQQLQKLMQMEVLKHDLESKSKELEESQEEAHLAALIGQSLLQRTEEMGAEIESTAMELLNRAENAEHEVKVHKHAATSWSSSITVLEAKLSKAYNHIRSMEVAKARTVDESDEISQEVETLRIRMQVLKAELTKAHDETQQIRTSKEYVDDKLESTKDALASLQTAHARLLTEWKVQGKRVQELEAADRYNLEHIARLEIENQSICLQHRLQERKEKKLISENESMTTKMTSQKQFMREFDTTKRQLEKMVRVFRAFIEALNTELDDLKDAFVAEQLRVSHLTKVNQKLQNRVDEVGKPEEARAAIGSPNSSAMLRCGSLFYELSMQLKEEMRHSSSQQQQDEGIQQHQDEANQLHSQKSSPDASAVKATATSQHNVPILNLSLDLDDNNDDDEDEESKRYYAASVSSTTKTSSASSSTSNSQQRAQDEQDILKEFFMLTAAAVKIAGGGLGNDTCNILNEDLYEEALDEGLTFDQYHKWLERRLEGAPELSVEKKATSSSAAMSSSSTRSYRRLSIS